jgi:excisionase family DNA binding protein
VATFLAGDEESNVRDIPSDWLTVREAAAYSRCGIKTLYRAVRNGQLRAARVGGRRKLVLRRDWLDAYLEACADNTPKEIVRLVRAA